MKNLFFLLIILTLFLANNVNAIPPVVDFNFTPSSPGLGQNIIFDPGITTNGTLNNLRWQFDTDGNTNYFLIGNDVNSIVTSDQWTDNDFTINPVWTTTGGIWGAGTGSLIGGSCTGCTIYTNAVMGPSSNISIHYTERRDLAGVAGQFKFLTTGTAYNSDGYDLFFDDSVGVTGNVALRKWSSGALTTLVTAGTQDVGVTYDVNIIRRTDGNISVYINNVFKASVIDTEFTSGDKILFATGNSPASTHTWDDLNVLTIFGSTINPDKNESHSFGSPGSKNICLTAGNNDGNSSICKSLTVGNTITFKVYDENVLSGISAATIVGDGNTFTTDGSGDAFITTDVFSFPLTLTVSKTGYDTRTFTYLDLNGLLQDRNVLLRYAPTTNDIDFKFYGPDETTVLTNRYIVVTKNSFVAGRIKTNSDGIGSINLAGQESGYRFLVYPVGTDSNLLTIDYNYSTVSVTINNPKDESTAVDINALIGFNINIAGLGAQSITTTSFPYSSIVILGNTINAYTASIVDTNAGGQTYYARTYILNAIGDVSALSITPYLITVEDGILVNFKVVDILTNNTIPNIRLTLSKGIVLSNVVVEDQLTDVAGIAQLVMLPQNQYFIQVTSPNQDTNYFPEKQFIVPTTQNFTVYIGYSSTGTTISTTDYDINFAPGDSILSGSSSKKIDVNVATSISFNRIIIELRDNNVVEYSAVCLTSPCVQSFTTLLSLFDSNSIGAYAIIETSDLNYYSVKTYQVQLFVNDVIEKVKDLKNTVNPLALGILALVITIGGVTLLGSSPGGNNAGQVFIPVILFGVFVYLWFTNTPLLLGYTAAVFGASIIYIWSRNRSSG